MCTPAGIILSAHMIINVMLSLRPQAQVVLQGKSRSVIIRELQRTNLDVNLAVNNLLSRDDEDGDDGDDTASESYLPGGLSKKKKRRVEIGTVVYMKLCNCRLCPGER